MVRGVWAAEREWNLTAQQDDAWLGKSSWEQEEIGPKGACSLVGDSLYQVVNYQFPDPRSVIGGESIKV